jgi:chromosome segregation protein
VQAVEQESDTTRAAVLAATSTLGALRQARDNAATARDRVAAERERLEVEARELTADTDRARTEHDASRHALDEARAALEIAVSQRAAAEAGLASQRADRERIGQALAANGRELAGKEARLRSLEELDASRATFGDAARFILGEAGRRVHSHGAVADHLQVERSFERAVDALLGDLLQHVIVDRAADVTTAFELLGEHNAGRCGFVVLDDAKDPATAEPPVVVPQGTRALASVVRATGPHANVLTRLIGRALVADSFDAARELAGTVSVPVAARTGEVFRGAWVVQGGSRQDVRGILESRAEMLSLRDDVQAMGAEIQKMTLESTALDASVPAAEAALAALVAEHHGQEKAIVGLEAQVGRTSDDLSRLGRRLDVVATERSRAEEEERAAEQLRDESAAAIALHESQQRDAEGRLDTVQARLQSAREHAEAKMRLVTEARTEQAALVERSSALETEVARLEEAARELEERIAGRRADIARTEVRREELRTSIRETEHALDDDVRALDTLKVTMRGHDERVVALRDEFNAGDHEIRGARHALEGVRAEVMQSEVAKATAAADLGHLASACLEAVGASLDEVVAAVARMEQAGELVAPARRIATASAPDDDEEAGPEAAVEEAIAAETAGPEVDESQPLTPEEVIADLKRKIERLGPVNMMAIEQFDELESRHTFLTTQRKDLLDSIAQTGEAIRKIDKTTRERFEAAFLMINQHFQETFTTLFGGGRAGLVLIDQENDPESGIDIIAQPPGKRLQNVQLLSGGEKALSAMALMFAIFKYRPSPFCLLDEIDAPLDDANIGRFVEMLLGMQTNTQFILITHNRKTMEIANRLYGVTMEEPGVSKLISVQLN